MAFNSDQFRDVISRVLKDAGLYSDAAVELLMMTAAVESNFGTYLNQVNGPALGVFQMEPNTHDDIWDNYLRYKGNLYELVSEYQTIVDGSYQQLETNLAYAIVMTRVHYLRVPEPLPNAADQLGLAQYWKEHYNTRHGKGKIEHAIEKYRRYCT